MKLFLNIRQFLRLDDIRLRNKFLILYLCCVFLPVILTNVIFYQVISNNVEEQRIEDINLNLEQMKNELWMQIEAAASVSYVFFSDYNLYTLLDSTYGNPADFVADYDQYLRRVLNSYTSVYTSVQNIKIYVNNPTILHSGGVAFLDQSVREKDWFRALDKRTSSEPVIVQSPKEDTMLSILSKEENDSFSIIRVMDYFNSLNTWDKVLKIELKTSAFDTVLSNLNIPGNVYLVDQDGNIQYTTDESVNWKQEQHSIAKLADSNSMLLIETESLPGDPLAGWKVMSLVPNDEILHEVRSSGQFIIWITFINLIVASSIIVIISRSFTTRLGFILKQMKRVKNQHFEVITKEESTDEIGQLTSEFNRMTLQIGSLINDVYVSDIKEKNMELEHRHAQLNALQSQINPHFLFNALETIRMRSIIKKETETARIIHNMAKLFRSSLTWKRDKVKVEEEMEFIYCFLEIQKYRFADRLEYTIDIDQNAEQCLVPKLIYLPFVENACIHGIERMKKGGRVEVKLKVIDEQLHFTIIDNGAGMSVEQQNKIYSYLNENSDLGERIGMQNVLYRLKLIYDQRFTFHLESEIGIGTKIHVTLPAER